VIFGDCLWPSTLKSGPRMTWGESWGLICGPAFCSGINLGALFATSINNELRCDPESKEALRGQRPPTLSDGETLINTKYSCQPDL